MSVQTGRALLLKMQPREGAPYETIGGLRTQTIMFNATPIDVTHAASEGRWRELLTQSGVRDVRIEGQGLFSNASSDRLFRAGFFAGTHIGLQIIVPELGALTGDFAITELHYLGDYDGEMSWKIELHSAGEVQFASA